MMPSRVSNLPGAVYRVLNDPGWTIVFISDGLQALAGIPAAKLIGKPLETLIHPDVSAVPMPAESCLKLASPSTR